MVALVLVAGCRATAPVPLSERDLVPIICQESDLGENYRLIVWLHPPDGETFFDEAVVNYSGLKFDSGSPAYISVHCELIVFEDETAAQRAFAKACDQSEMPLSYPDAGEEACSFGHGVVRLYFRRGEALAAMLADSGGHGLLRLAQRVDERLR
jgi:hypothetical protein